MMDDDEPRLASGVWVSAFLRRVAADGGHAALMRRGHESAGAIWIEVMHRDGVDLWAPVSLHRRRCFARTLTAATPLDVMDRMTAELRFDPDLWHVGVEDPAGRAFLADDECEEAGRG